MTRKPKPHEGKPATLPPKPPTPGVPPAPADNGLFQLQIPMFDGTPVELGYSGRQIHVTNLSYEQATKLKRLVLGLHAAHKVLRATRDRITPKSVDSVSDAIKWLLEQLPDSEFDQSEGILH